jgi:hypothetical protein
MPEKTKTGKWVFPVRDAGEMKKEGWFIRETNTKGISVRLARLKTNNNVVVQAYIFDTKLGWDLDKAKKWLKQEGVKWIAELNESSDTFKGECIKILTVISGNDISYKLEKDKNMSEQTIVGIAKDDDGSRERVIVETDKGLPQEIVKVPKRIVTHRSRKKGSNGKSMNLNGKDYGKKIPEVLDSSEISKDLNKCGTNKDEDKEKNTNVCGVCSTSSDKKDKRKMVRTPKKK